MTLSIDLRSLAHALGGEISSGQVLAPGPGHSKADRSMSVRPDSSAPDGFVVHSFTTDDPIVCKDYVRNKLGLAPFKPNGRDRTPAAAAAPASKRMLVAEYNYTDAAGALLYQVLRYEPKAFRQRAPDVFGEWIWKLDDRRVVYRLPELLKYPDATVFVCEGEKDADRVAALGHCATTVAAGKWTDECIEVLAGRDCIVLEDNDDKGRQRALEAAQRLHGVAKTVRIVSLPNLPDKGDVSDWLDADPRRADRLIDVCFDAPIWAPHSETENEPPPDSEPKAKFNLDGIPLHIDDWLKRDLPRPDKLIGEWLTSTSRAILNAETGLGKTNFGMALGGHGSAGVDFLHWRVERPIRVLYVDGEMSNRLLKLRAADVVRRLSAHPKGLHLLSRQDAPEMPPLNTEAGAAFIHEVIDRIGGIDMIELDNIMSLISGSMKDEEAWQQTLPLIDSLTRRCIGQIWIHHTGYDTSHGYGTKTREWQMDTVLIGTAAKRADTDVSFTIEFPKARERTPETRRDFEPATIALINDKWISSAAAVAAEPPSPTGAKFLAALVDVFAGTDPVMFQGWKAVKIDHWRLECERMGLIDKDKSEKGKAHVARSLFSKYKLELITRNHIACNDDLVWIVK